MGIVIHSLEECVKYLDNSEVISYPTEAVFGLGCNPNSKKAVMRLLSLKRRSVQKGLILIAADYNQLTPWVADEQLSPAQKTLMFSKWPGPMTWILPARSTTPYWLTGNFSTLAVRVSNHPAVIDLCVAYGRPLVSTSANIANFPPCRHVSEVLDHFGNDVPVFAGETGGRKKPSPICNILTGEYVR
ncbi:Sua5/YciO/YrdC/YwlC family protein [Candidatus Erwinia haradaeae]|uniref:Threonylcarbamoyl-AMP synthase n=1 Tax=Candidatus Erwinia haradaeae TaxID=1922217 RepID=A0A451DAQ7_9GAMM|nr:Sua5/YciO/YrdC/YwlC family protein [Candidatus Erwinia haradaeae]VFP83413.1 Threonylcarbamoyl-AMP synthase [Candidatus Erwinia haradaeae]